MTQTKNQRIGLTGGIASGKSTVAAIIREQGIPVVDADQVARDIVQPGEAALQEIFDTFGDEYRLPDGHLDRKRLGQHIFTHPEARQTLNHITHPRVAQRAEEMIQELHQQGHHTVVYEVPLLFENHLQHFLDATILVAIPLDLQIQRLIERDHIDKDAALARINSQMPLDEKRALADFTVDNTGEISQLHEQISAILRDLNAHGSGENGH